QPALRKTEQVEALDAERIHDDAEIGDPGIEGEILVGPVREAAPALVVANDREVPREELDHVPPDGAFPRVLEMREPMGGPHERGAVTVHGVGEANAVRSGDETYRRCPHGADLCWNRP